MTLYIDDREPLEMIRALENMNLDIEVRRLESGDYVFGSVGIERKTLSDLLSSLNQWGSLGYRRYWDQLKVLKDTYENPILLVEGDLHSLPRLADKKRINGALMVTILSWKIPILQTLSMSDSAWRIGELYLKEGAGKKGRAPPPAVKKALNPEDIRRNMLCCIQGISPRIAEEILKRYSFQDLANGCKVMFQLLSKEIRGLSAKKASILYQVFHDPQVIEDNKEGGREDEYGEEA